MQNPAQSQGAQGQDYQQMLKGLLGSGYQDPMQGGLLGAAQAIGGMSGYTKTPVSMGQVLGAAGAGMGQGRQQAMARNAAMGGQQQQMQQRNMQIQQMQAQMGAATLAAKRAQEQRDIVKKLRTNEKYESISGLPDTQFMAAAMEMNKPMYGKVIKKPGEKLVNIKAFGEKEDGEVDYYARAGSALSPKQRQDAGLVGDAVWVWDKNGIVPKKLSGDTPMEIEKSLITAIKPYRNAATALLTKAQTVSSSLAQGTGSGDIAAIKSFERMIEDAVTRKDDIDMQNAAQSALGRFGAFIANFKEGDILTPQKRSEIQDMANQMLRVGMTGNVMTNINELHERAGTYKGVKVERMMSSKMYEDLSNWKQYLGDSKALLSGVITQPKKGSPKKFPAATFIADGKSAWQKNQGNPAAMAEIEKLWIAKGLNPAMLRNP